MRSALDAFGEKNLPYSDNEARKTYQREYYQKNRTKRLLQRKEYLKRSGKSGAEYKEQDFEAALMYSSRFRAIASNLEHTILKEDIVIPEMCPYLNIPLTKNRGKGRHWYNASVDRIDNSKGYTPDNIQVVSVLANTMKSHSTIEELRAFAKGVERIHGL